MIDFGRRAKTDLVHQAEARAIAARQGCILRGLGGTEDGVIGALAAVGLAVTGEDGRFLVFGKSRELQGVQTVQAILDCGISAVRVLDGQLLTEGLVETEGKLRPAFRGSQAVLFVKRQEDNPALWFPVKLD
jgi:hypothetical protein